MPAFAPRLARHRLLVLAAAIVLGAVAAGGLRPAPAVFPEAFGAPVEIRIAQAPADPKAPAEPVAPAEPAEPKAKAKAKAGKSLDIDVDDQTGRVRISGTDREFDSFEAFVEQAPWIAGLVFAVTFLVFLTPLLIIALVIWYKMRKQRMLNETMIRLAEKGVVPPAEAYGAVVGGQPVAGPATAPLYAQAKEVRRKAVWSDLRKGIILGAVGLGFTFYSMLDDGSPNFPGLVLLFLGLAYVVLWYFEDKQVAASAPPPVPPLPQAPSPPSPPGPPFA